MVIAKYPAVMDLNRFDLNLLLVFEAVSRERSVTRAAERLNLSQPALSHALNRLRHVLEDRLFVRGSSGMEPTPRAEQLDPVVRRILSELRVTLEPMVYDPMTSRRSFRIAGNNYFAVVVAPTLINDCIACAPGVRLTVRPSGTMNVRDLLNHDDLDLAVTSFDLTDAGLTSTRLIDDSFVAILRKDHPAAGRPLTVKGFAALTRINITSSGEDISFVDQALAAAGASQLVGSDVPYLSVAASVAGSDRVAILAGDFARALGREYPVLGRSLPFVSPRVDIFMSWSKRLDDDPAHRWLRGMMSSAADQVSRLRDTAAQDHQSLPKGRNRLTH